MLEGSRAGFVAEVKRALWGVIRPVDRVEPRAWIESHIDLSHDPTAARSGKIRLDAWQVEPILSQFDPACRMVVMLAIEQVGKSTIWRLPMVYKMLFDPAPRWVIYESDDKAEDINRRTLEPLLKSIPELACQLNRITSTKRCYHLANGSITDFSGAGADITSKPVKDGVADELDRWGTAAFAAQNLRNFRKRFRTFARGGEGCLVVSCSPKTEGGARSATYQLFMDETNQAYWHLRCQKCGALTMRSCDIHNLQWEMDGDAINDGTLRLACPACGFEHIESQAVVMTESGGYVAQKPEITEARGYQVGALGAPRVFRWRDIAIAQLNAGRSAELLARVDFYNSWRGLPFDMKCEGSGREEKLKKRCSAAVVATDVDYVVMGCDTQNDGVYYVVRAVDKKRNTYLIDHGGAVTFDDLNKVWNTKYYDQYLAGAIIDAGGNRAKEVEDFVKDLKGFVMYKGNSRIGVRKRAASENKQLILANPTIYKGELLYHIYAAKPDGVGGWYLPYDLNPKYIEQVVDVRPDSAKKFGNHFENWEGTGNDHYFDCEKEILVLLELINDSMKKKAKPIKAESYYK